MARQILQTNEVFAFSPLCEGAPAINDNFEELYAGKDSADASIASLLALPLRSVPSSVNVVAGGTPVGTVANVQTMLDGNVYQVPETATTPGFDIQFTFTGLTYVPDTIVARAWYTGTESHQVEFELYDYDASEWVQFHQFTDSASYLMHQKTFVPESRFVNSGTAILRFDHVTAGNPAHDFYADYIGLWKCFPN